MDEFLHCYDPENDLHSPSDSITSFSSSSALSNCAGGIFQSSALV